MTHDDRRSVEWRRKHSRDLLGGLERRSSLERIEFRRSADGLLHLSGYACTTNTPYDMGWYTESIKSGAFAATLNGHPDVVLNINHGEGGSGLPIARTKAGNLELGEDRTGLKVDADLDPEDPDVSLLARKMNSGNLDGQMSFCFSVVRQSFSDDYLFREIQEVSLNRGDVSVVTQAANPTTSSSIRTAGSAGDEVLLARIAQLEAEAERREWKEWLAEQKRRIAIERARYRQKPAA
jgi:uncharacterized protein